MNKKTKTALVLMIFIVSPDFSNFSQAEAKTLTISKKTPVVETAKSQNRKAQNKTQKINAKDGDISDKIHIYEIMPNSKGSDDNKEWIKLYNFENNKINLGNWKIIISDPENPNKKAKTIILTETTVIPAKSSIKLSALDLPKLKFPNKNTKIELKDFSEKAVDDYFYSKAGENEVLKNYSSEKKNQSLKSKAENIKLPGESSNNEHWLYFSPIPIFFLLSILWKLRKK